MGEENAQTAKTLCELLKLDKRALTAAIERERRGGKPIIASCDSANPGYYLAGTQEEMRAYCNSLKHRAEEINKTRAACLKTIDSLPKERGLKY
ncbi:MAG: hypothetical protein VZS12_09520 [Ruminococcus bromii]|nr:hypothetical protein [Ruminococcus bromii]